MPHPSELATTRAEFRREQKVRVDPSMDFLGDSNWQAERGFLLSFNVVVYFVLLAQEEGVEYAVDYAEEDNRGPEDIWHEPIQSDDVQKKGAVLTSGSHELLSRCPSFPSEVS